MASIYDPEGERIAEATLELPVNGTTASLRQVKKGAGLLHFYFGKQQRWVLVDTPDGRVRGRLHTRWEGARRMWEITFQTPRDLPQTTALIPLATAESAETSVAEH